MEDVPPDDEPHPVPEISPDIPLEADCAPVSCHVSGSVTEIYIYVLFD